jgi:hypothetical protein
MGCAPFADGIDPFFHPVPNDVTLAFALMYWKEVEAEKGVYDFNRFERRNFFGRLTEHGVRLIIRVVADYPTDAAHLDIPQWLYYELEKNGGAGTFYDVDGLRGYAPDYADPYFIERHGKLIEAVADRYDRSPHVAFVQLGSLGHWGEWHNYLLPEKCFLSESICKKIADQYIGTFKEKKMQMRKPNAAMCGQNIGLYNDMLGNEESTKLWEKWIDECGFSCYNKKSAFGGEFASTHKHTDFFGRLYPELKRAVVKAGITYICNRPPKGADGEYAENAADLFKTIGYRIRAESARFEQTAEAGGAADLSVSLCNDGIAPFYYGWRICAEFIGASGESVLTVDLGTEADEILPGKSLRIDARISVPNETGAYALKLGIFDPNTGKAAVYFANEGADRHLTLGEIFIR